MKILDKMFEWLTFIAMAVLMLLLLMFWASLVILLIGAIGGLL